MRISDWSSDVCSSDLRFHINTPAMRLIARMHGAGWYSRQTDLFQWSALPGPTGAHPSAERAAVRPVRESAYQGNRRGLSAGGHGTHGRASCRERVGADV